jgi:DNA-binding SARP family transcriptional activator
LLDRALRLWHGEPLAGLPGQWVERMRYGWRQQWLNAVVAWAEVQLQLGNTATVVDRLAGLVGEYPLVEPLTAMLMRALCAVGRPAEAMLHYISIRQRLVEQLGTDPTHSLRELYQDILQGS